MLWRSGSGVVAQLCLVPPECTESSLTLFVWLKEHVLLFELLGRRAEGQGNPYPKLI